MENAIDYLLALKSLCKQVHSSACEGQTLPRLILFVLIHSVLHSVIFSKLIPWPSSPQLSAASFWWTSAHYFSQAILFFNILLAVFGFSLLVALYRRSVQTIFNRALPPSITSSLPSFNAHLSLLRPLEIIFRYLTSPLRILPDVIVLGEVRCGTTTICHHLSKNLPEPVEVGVPFCLWRHPELDHKESFYFVGHYLGYVNPKFYSLCFPLLITKWYHQFFRRKLYMSFDGCAQYLTSPTAPYLIARAYKERGLPPPVLVACVRDPVDQAVSWWRYENNAMKWGESMNLTTWNTSLRSTLYPPQTICSALRYSQSSYVQKAYVAAEDLGRAEVDRLPQWAMTWPCGQLSAIGLNGKFAENIRRYERVFRDTFGSNTNTSNEEGVCIERKSRNKDNVAKQDLPLEYVTVVPIESLSQTTTLSSVLASIIEKIVLRRKSMPNEFIPHRYNACLFLKDELERSIHHALGQTGGKKMITRNPGSSYEDSEPTDQDKNILADFFEADTKELERLCNMVFKWRKADQSLLPSK